MYFYRIFHFFLGSNPSAQTRIPMSKAQLSKQKKSSDKALEINQRPYPTCMKILSRPLPLFLLAYKRQP